MHLPITFSLSAIACLLLVATAYGGDDNKLVITAELLTCKKSAVQAEQIFDADGDWLHDSESRFRALARPDQHFAAQVDDGALHVAVEITQEQVQWWRNGLAQASLALPAPPQLQGASRVTFGGRSDGRDSWSGSMEGLLLTTAVRDPQASAAHWQDRDTTPITRARPPEPGSRWILQLSFIADNPQTSGVQMVETDLEAEQVFSRDAYLMTAEPLSP